MKYLIVVESPTKAKTLSRFLGPDFKVLASKGHIKDLPKGELGVDINNNFRPKYVTLRGKGKIIEEIKKAAAKAEAVFLATDPDREGEAISWHLENVLEKVNKNIYRINLHEITERAVREALAKPGKVDMKKVEAQQARRILDRIVGYKLSPLLWKKVVGGLSAGRVQSVALRMIVEREEEIKKFIPKPYWTIEAELEKNGSVFTASFPERLWEKKKAEEIYEILKQAQGLEVLKIKKRRIIDTPPPPFTTSKLQQEASTKLGFSPKKTMMFAQRLYEGVELPEGSVGLITYMRTDSVRVSEQAIDMARDFIFNNFGRTYLPKQPRIFKNKAKAQDAHEAIRPTDVFKTPDYLRGFLERDLWLLYELIWKRFLASQMESAVYDSTTVELETEGIVLRASGRKLVSEGYTVLYTAGKQSLLPELEEGEIIKIKEVRLKEHTTTPPPRFTEASLVKALEEAGVGRPSTYAQIVSTVQERGYVKKESGRLFPTPLGEIVNRLLTGHFPDFINVEFTAKMEEGLDKIERGSASKDVLLEEFYSIFSKTLKKATKEMKSLKVLKKTDIKCPVCSSPMDLRIGKVGYFLVCSRYPDCKVRLEAEVEGEKVIPLLSEKKCPLCGYPLAIRRNKNKRFLMCVRYPECRYTAPYPVGVKCPQCGGEIVELYTKKGRKFYGCSNYPKCRWMSFKLPSN